MAAVKVNRGMPRPEAPASSVPKDQWDDLVIVRKLWAQSQLPFDCRMLRLVADDAPAMAAELGYEGAESFLREGLQLDPELVNSVVSWLEREQPTGPAKPPVDCRLGTHGGDRRSERVKQDQGIAGTLKRGGNPGYLKARLHRDHPELAQALERGELRSVRSAAVEAGIIKPSPPSLQLKEPAPTAQKLLAKKGKEWCLALMEELSELVFD